MQEYLHRRNSEKIGGPPSRTPTRWRKKNDTDASKPVGRHLNLPNHSHHNTTICGPSPHHGNTDGRKNLEQRFILQPGTLPPYRINGRLSFHLSIQKFMSPNFPQWQRSSTINLQHHTIPPFAPTKGQRSKRQPSKSLTVVIQPLSTRLIKLHFCVCSERLSPLLKNLHLIWFEIISIHNVPS